MRTRGSFQRGTKSRAEVANSQYGDEQRAEHPQNHVHRFGDSGQELYTARAVLRTEQCKLESAEQDLKRAIALNPNYADAYVRLGASYEYAGRPRDALSAYSKEELSAYLDKLERNGQVWHGLHYLRADVRAMQGRTSEAFAELEKAQQLGWHRTWWPQFDPSPASLRGDPRFNAWLRSIDASNEPLRARVLSAEPFLKVSMN